MLLLRFWLDCERIWMSKDDDSTASNWVERAEQKQRVMSAEAEHGVVARNHQKRLHQPTHVYRDSKKIFFSAETVYWPHL